MGRELLDSCGLAAIAAFLIGAACHPSMAGGTRCILVGLGLLVAMLTFVCLALDITKHAGVNW
jgi:hypothetical protein